MTRARDPIIHQRDAMTATRGRYEASVSALADSSDSASSQYLCRHPQTLT